MKNVQDVREYLCTKNYKRFTRTEKLPITAVMYGGPEVQTTSTNQSA